MRAAAPAGCSHTTSAIEDRLAYAHDASHYLLVPEQVHIAGDAVEVGRILVEATQSGTPLTFRSGGTSLSGQAQSDRLLLDTRRNFRQISVLDAGRRVRVQPGATVRQVNARLASTGHRLGPDPASEVACTIGGVVNNNSSGMVCGTENNTYRTLESLIAVLPNGVVVDTSAVDADRQLAERAPQVHEGLRQLSARVRGNPESVRTITRQFSLKNTMGYSLNAFLDYDDPVQVLAHLLIGSEGTLAFLAEATFRTIPIRSHVATAFLVFPTLVAATRSLPELVASGLSAIELLDTTSLRVARTDPGSGGVLPANLVDGQAGLLVEYQEATGDALGERLIDGERLLHRLDLCAPAAFSTDPGPRGDLWHLRKGLYATVAGSRPSGTTALLEDVAVPVAALAETCAGLLTLFGRHGYDDSVIFGHAKDGNIHFLLNERFDDARTLARYTAFTEDMVELILGADGTLKAEHGTGRIMAPFVRRQYGDELYDVMCQIKRLCDPAGILNPGVIISDDPVIHLRHLKTTPPVEAEVDRCVECGYCEPVCPSRDLTLTPRQRIVLRREFARASLAGDTSLAAQLRQAYAYDGLQTCAADGMCATACPVLINTGDLVTRLRAEEQVPARAGVWSWAAGHWALTTTLASRALSIARVLPPALVRSTAGLGRRVLGADTVPMWEPTLPRGGSRRRHVLTSDPVAVVFPACVGAMFAPEAGGVGATAALIDLCQRAGVAVTVPRGIADTCCGTPWKSKGMREGYALMAERVLPWLLTATDGGRLPVVVDASSCAEGLRQLIEQQPAGSVDIRQPLVVMDAVEFVQQHLRARLTVTAPVARMAVHPTCSTARLGSTPALLALAHWCADDVVVPASWGCCGFAGDRGMLHPELTAAATAEQAAEIGAVDCQEHVSCNRTCEIAMTRATGQPYRHILEVILDATAG